MSLSWSKQCLLAWNKRVLSCLLAGKKLAQCNEIQIQVDYFMIGSQGPCDQYEWLVPVRNGLGLCDYSPCPLQADGRHIFWDYDGVPGCYRSNTKGPCRPGEVFIISNFRDREATCVSWYYYRHYSDRRNTVSVDGNEESVEDETDNLLQQSPLVVEAEDQNEFDLLPDDYSFISVDTELER